MRERKSKHRWLKWIELGTNFVDTFEYSIEFSSQTQNKRKVIYKEISFVKHEKSNSPDFELTMKLLLVARKRLEKIKKDAHPISGVLVDQEGIITPQRYKLLLKTAKEFNIKPL